MRKDFWSTIAKIGILYFTFRAYIIGVVTGILTMTFGAIFLYGFPPETMVNIPAYVFPIVMILPMIVVGYGLLSHFLLRYVDEAKEGKR